MNKIQAQVAQCINIASPEVALPENDAQLKMFLSLEIDALDLDSLDKMELVMEIENHFEIMLDEDAIVGCQNISDLVKLVSDAVHPS